jgi:hypothetical protein
MAWVWPESTWLVQAAANKLAEATAAIINFFITAQIVVD